MFQKIWYRLLLSYLVVFASILGIFATAVRFFFTRSLHQQLTEKLTVLGQGAAANSEFEAGKIKIDHDFSSKELIARAQALQWFDSQGHVISQQGKTVLNLPLSAGEILQIQNSKIRIQGITLPIINSDNDQLIGYVRASQSLENLDDTLEKLDWGLGGGIVVALILSGMSGVLLTRQAMQPIEQNFQQLKQFTSDASHELRSPLMVIKSNVAVALKYSKGMRLTDAEKFNAIASATNQMTRLTEDLLLLARSDKVPSRDGHILNLEEILEQVVDLYKSQAQAKQINLKTQLTKPLYLLGDPVQITRLFTNLVENALHYTLSGGVVEIQTSRVNQYIYIKVNDTGVGIAPQDLEHVFDRFWRANQSRSYWDGGSGLGLAIATAIAQNHGGLISVTSQIGVGSCFTVRLLAAASTSNWDKY